jgi:serine protease Do
MPFGQPLHSGASPHSWRAALIGGAAALALLLAPPPAGARNGGNGVGGEANITAKVQNETKIALPSLHPLVERVLPAVVNISAQLGEETAGQSEQSSNEGDQSPFDQFLRRFFENRGFPQWQLHRQVMALGSGFIIDPTGYIVTNNHVVSGSHKITVILQDNSRHPAKVVGRDPKTDLALLKIGVGRKLPYVSWGDSDAVHVGDWVMAVGNPFGLGGTVTAGIVSALGRNINEGPYDDFIQIDAPINRGNSGGPTFDLAGRVIGINTAIYSPSGGSVGIGFAVPSNTARNVVEQLKTKGHVTRGWLGVAIQGITPSIARSLGLDPEKTAGALVASVNPKSPAERAGIKQGDVIVDAGGHAIKTVHDLPRIVAATPPGRRIDLAVLRDGTRKTLAVTVGEMPENLQQVASAEGRATSLGLQLSAIDAQLRRKYSIPKDVEGVVVTDVGGDTPAAALGIEPGDVIMSIDRKHATSPQQAARELKEAAAKGSILLLINRHGTSRFVGLSVSPGAGGGRPPG